MKYIRVNNTNLVISQGALGTATIGAPDNKYQAEEILDTFMEQGGNLLDSALVYSDWIPGEKGRSEKTIGRWMKERGNRHDVIISTKGAHPRLETMNVPRLSDGEITSDLETSLKNLQTDYIDIYFLHRDDVGRDVGDIMAVMDRHVKDGKIRYFGLSNWSVERIEAAVLYCKQNGLAEPVVNQLKFSPAKVNCNNIDPTIQVMNQESFEYHAGNKMSVFAFSPQANGLFSKIDSGKSLSDGMISEYGNEINYRIYNEIKRLSEKYGRPIAELVVSLLVSNPKFQTVPILGCSSKQQLLASMRGLDLEISEQEFWAVIQHRLV